MSTSSQTSIANRHDYDTSFTNEYDTNKTALTIITPTTGASIAIKGIYINTEANTGAIRIYFGTSGNTIYKLFPARTQASGYIPVVIEGALNEVVKLTSTVGDGGNYFVLINYKES